MNRQSLKPLISFLNSLIDVNRLICIRKQKKIIKNVLCIELFIEIFNWYLKIWLIILKLTINN